MNSPPRITWWALFISRPVVLQAYIVFAVCYSLFSGIGMFSPLAKDVVPLTGWHGGVLYLGTTYFAVVASTPNDRRKLIYVTQLQLALWTMFGCLEIAFHVMRPNVVRWSGNPYVSFHDFRPMFTIVLPAAWALMFFSPGMRKWTASASQQAEARWQFSLADLLFVLLLVCMALASTLALATLMHQTHERFVRSSADATIEELRQLRASRLSQKLVERRFDFSETPNKDPQSGTTSARKWGWSAASQLRSIDRFSRHPPRPEIPIPFVRIGGPVGTMAETDNGAPRKLEGFSTRQFHRTTFWELG